MKLVAFLRAINVGGRNVPMAELRRHFANLGLENVETFIASGNVIFDAPPRKKAAVLEKQIESHLHSALGYEVATFVRTEKELAAIAAYKPFSEAELASAGALNVAFLAEPLGETEKAVLESVKTEMDDFHTHLREVYWRCTKKQSESKFSNVVFERKLKLKATFRGINTVRKLAAKLVG